MDSELVATTSVGSVLQMCGAATAKARLTLVNITSKNNRRQSIWCDDAVKMQRSTRIADRWTSTLSTATAAAANWPGSPRRPGSVRCSELPICPVIHTLSSNRHSPTSSTNSTRKTSQISNFSKTASTDAKSEITNCLVYNCCNYSYFV